MKRTLYLKILLGYLLFGILGFLTVATFTSHQSMKYMEKKEARDLYRESTLIATTYATNYYNSSVTLDDLQQQLNALDSYLSAQIWIVNTQGEILVNSREHVDMEHLTTIEEMNIADFGSSYYQKGTFYDSFSEEQLSVFSQITINYKVKGYVFIHKPMSQIISYHDGILNTFYLTLLILFFTALVILAVFTFAIYLPIRKITKGADAYAEGDFNYRIDVHNRDEIGYLAASFQLHGK